MDDKSRILDRVIFFADHLDVSLRSFSLSIGASPGYLHRLQAKKSNIGGDFIEKIIQSYKQLNPVWLVTGEGNMLKKDELIGESGLQYGERDFFKEALLNYLDDEDVREKVIRTVSKESVAYTDVDKEKN